MIYIYIYIFICNDNLWGSKLTFGLHFMCSGSVFINLGKESEYLLSQDTLFVFVIISCLIMKP